MCSQSESYKIRSVKPEFNSSTVKKVTYLFGLPLASLVEVRINLLGCFIHLITASVRQLQVQKHEIEFLLPEAFNGLFSRPDPHSTEADSLQKCSNQILQGTDSERTPCWILKRKHADPEAAPH